MFLWQIFEYFRNWYYGTEKKDQAKKETPAAGASGCPFMEAEKKKEASAKVEDASSKVEETDKSTAAK